MRWRFSIQQWTSTHLVTVGSWTKLFCPQWTCGQNLWTVWRMASRPADGSRIKLCNSACVQFIFQTLAKDLVLWVTTSLRDHSPHYLSWQQMQLRQLDWPGGERSGRFSWTLLASEVTEVLPDTKTIICIGWKSSLETSFFRFSRLILWDVETWNCKSILVLWCVEFRLEVSNGPDFHKKILHSFAISSASVSIKI